MASLAGKQKVWACLKCKQLTMSDPIKYYLWSSYLGMQVAVCKGCFMKGNEQ